MATLKRDAQGAYYEVDTPERGQPGYQPLKVYDSQAGQKGYKPPSDAEIAAQAEAEWNRRTADRAVPDGAQPGDSAADTRSPFRKLFDSVVGPVTTAVAKAGQYGPADVGQMLVSKASGGAVPMPAGSTSDEAAQRNAELVVPQTPVQAAAMAGTAGAGPLVGAAAKAGVPLMARIAQLATKYPALARIAGGTVGGGVGGTLDAADMGDRVSTKSLSDLVTDSESSAPKPTSGGIGTRALEGAATGAAQGGLLTAGGEVVGKLGSKIARSLPGAAGRIAAKDAADVGETVENLVPPLAGARTGEELRTMATGPGQKSLGQAKGDVVDTIAARVGDISVPSLGGRPMSLQAANDALSEIGARAFSRNPLDRTVNGIDQRQLYGRIATEIEQGVRDVSPGAANAWKAVQQAYAAGRSVLKPLESPKAYLGGPSGDVELNIPFLQRYITAPKNEAILRSKLGDDGFEAIVDTLTRGAGVGAKDEVSRAAGLVTRILTGAGTGAGVGYYTGGREGAERGALAGAAGGALLPNARTRYAGIRQPYAIRSPYQTILDALAQKYGGQMVEGR